MIRAMRAAVLLLTAFPTPGLAAQEPATKPEVRIAELVQRLGVGDNETRRAASKELVSRGEATRKEIEQGLKSTDVAVGTRCKLLLETLAAARSYRDYKRRAGARPARCCDSRRTARSRKPFRSDSRSRCCCGRCLWHGGGPPCARASARQHRVPDGHPTREDHTGDADRRCGVGRHGPHQGSEAGGLRVEVLTDLGTRRGSCRSDWTPRRRVRQRYRSCGPGPPRIAEDYGCGASLPVISPSRREATTEREQREDLRVQLVAEHERALQARVLR